MITPATPRTQDAETFRIELAALIEAYRDVLRETNVVRGYFTDAFIDLWAIVRDGRIDDQIVIGLRDSGTQMKRLDDPQFRSCFDGWNRTFGAHLLFRYDCQSAKFIPFTL